jgi:hypothetical protein
MSDLRWPLAGCGLLLFITGCPDDADENLTEGGFTTGDETATTVSTTVTTNTSEGTTTDDSTTSASTTDTTTESTSTSIGTESSATDSSTTDDSTGTTDEGTGTTESSEPECGDGSAEPGELCLLAGTDYAIGGTAPRDVVAGDFDGDGDLDVATANETSDDVSVLLGNGNGTLGSASQYAVVGSPTRIVAGDLDGDDRTDIVTASPAENSVSVLLASASGGFEAADDYDVGTTPVDLALGDIAGGGLDIGVANSGSDDLSLLDNDGAGAFTLLGPYGTMGSAGGNQTITPSAVAIGNIAIAGAQDIFYAGLGRYGASPGVSPDGTINDGVSVQGTVGSTLNRADGGDANGDGDLDVVVLDASGVIYFQGNPGDAVATFQTTTLTAGTGPSEAIFAHVDSDPHLDIVVSNAGSNDVSIFLGNGNGTFAAAVSFACGSAPSGVAVADLDDDGHGDIICSNPGANEITVLLSNP